MYFFNRSPSSEYPTTEEKQSRRASVTQPQGKTQLSPQPIGPPTAPSSSLSGVSPAANTPAGTPDSKIKRHNRMQGTHEEVRERMRIYLASRPVLENPPPGSVRAFYKAITKPVWPKVCFIVGFITVLGLLAGLLKSQGLLDENPDNPNTTWSSISDNGEIMVLMHPQSDAAQCHSCFLLLIVVTFGWIIFGI